jgi:hypothetical protein
MASDSSINASLGKPVQIKRFVLDLGGCKRRGSIAVLKYEENLGAFV